MQTKIKEINIKKSYSGLVEYFARFDFDFFVFTVSATVICYLGLVMNSPSIIIGAMVLSPLLYPVIAMTTSFYLRDWKILRRSLLLLLIGFFVVVFTAAVLSLFVEIDMDGSEIVERVESSLYYYVVIALVSGFAGMFCFLWPKALEAMTGIAISIAILPPLVIFGVSLFDYPEFLAEVSGIVVINTLGIILGAVIALYFVSFIKKVFK